MNTKWAGILGMSGLFFLCVTSYSLQGCKKESPRAAVEKTAVSDSETLKGHKELGLALYEKGENAKAIEEFKKAITAVAEMFRSISRLPLPILMRR